MSAASQLRPLLRVGLPVAVAVIFVCLAIINIALVKTWRGEPEDGVLWVNDSGAVVASEIDPSGAGARAGILVRDVLFRIDGRQVETDRDVLAALHAATDGQTLTYDIVRQQAAEPAIAVTLQPMPLVRSGLYYSLAMVGILALVVGASVRLRRPNDPATLHFFWLTVAFFGVLAFTPSGSYKTFDYFFDWADLVARLALPPLFWHFALVFPDRSNPWVKSDAGRAVLPLIYLPALILGLGRVAVMAGAIRGPQPSLLLERIETAAHFYLAACLLGGLVLMIRALGRVRSVTARRQLGWIVWGSSLGALPFVLLYLCRSCSGTCCPARSTRRCCSGAFRSRSPRPSSAID